MAKEFTDAKGSMFLGRGTSFPIALEGVLKLSIILLYAEGYPAGEMKHGPLVLIEEGLPVIVLAPRDKYFEKLFKYARSYSKRRKNFIYN